MAIWRLINGSIVDVEFTGQRLINGVWVEGQSADAAIEATVSYGLEIGQSFTKTAVFESGITFAQELSDSPEKVAVFETEIETNLQLTNLYTQDLSIEAQASLDIQLSEFINNDVNYETALSVQAILGNSFIGNAIFEASSLFQQALTNTFVAELLGALDAAVSFQVNLFSAIENDAVYGDSVVFNSDLSLNITGGKSIAAAITLALTEDVQTSATISIEGALILGINQLLTNQTQAEINGSILLNQQLIFTAIQQGILDAGVSLSCIQSVTINGAAIILGMVTPSGRTLNVYADTGINRHTVEVSNNEIDIKVHSD